MADLDRELISSDVKSGSHALLGIVFSGVGGLMLVIALLSIIVSGLTSSTSFFLIFSVAFFTISIWVARQSQDFLKVYLVSDHLLVELHDGKLDKVSFDKIESFVFQFSFGRMPSSVLVTTTDHFFFGKQFQFYPVDSFLQHPTEGGKEVQRIAKLIKAANPKVIT